MDVELVVSGMTCNSCVNRLDEGLTALEEVKSTTIDLESGLVKIYMNGDTVDIANLQNVVKNLGYSLDGDVPISDFNWSDKSVWKQSAHNTKWCLIGCSIGDLGTIAAFQFIPYLDALDWAPTSVMLLAMFNGIMTSIALETLILIKQMGGIKEAFKVAIGMSLISMIGMEAAMNITDLFLTGGAMLTWWVIPPMLLAGFITPWPYNYWRLKKYGKSCH